MSKDERPYPTGWHAAALKHVRESPGVVVPRVNELIGPRSVLDVGCGPATWTAAFQEAGVEDVLGIEGAWLDPDLLQIDPERLLVHDLELPLTLERTFDLAISLEVGEHLSEGAAAQLVTLLTTAAPVVLFSAAVPFQGGTGHVNEQWPAYWQEKFAARGFVAVDVLRDALWNDERVAWYYRQNLMLYVRATALADYPALARDGVPEGSTVRALVHPDRYLRLAGLSGTRLLDRAKTQINHHVRPRLPARLGVLRR